MGTALGAECSVECEVCNVLTKHTCNLAEKVTLERRETWKHLKEACDQVIKHACHGMSDLGRKSMK